jgi:hypothetical protein
VHPGAVLFFHLLDGRHFATKLRQLSQLVLDGLQPFLPLPVSHVRLRRVSTLKAILLVQGLNLSDLHAETPNLFPKDF